MSNQNHLYINKKLGRAIQLMKGSYRDKDCEHYYTYICRSGDPLSGYTIERHDVPRRQAFDWLHGKDKETAKVKREEKLRIVAEKVRADCELIITTCADNDSWLEHLYQDRDRTLCVTPVSG